MNAGGLLERCDVAKKKRVGRPPLGEGGVRDHSVVARGREEWKKWVDELADHCRLDISDLIDQSLVEMARLRGFDKKAPKR